MQRTARHRLLAALLTFFVLIVGAMLPIRGIVSAASAATNCPNGEGGPFCILVISAPESVPAGQVFTVQVAVTTDGTIVAKSDPCASKVLVRLELDGVSEGPFFISSQSINAKAGIATFNVSVQNPGRYELIASAGVVGDAPPTTSNCGNYFYQSDTANFMAVDVAAGQPIAPCPDNVSCFQTTSGTGSAATLFADSVGSFTAAFGALVAGEGCGNLSPADTNGVLTFNLTDATASKTVIFALSSDLITNGIGRYNICWKSAIPFTPLGGGPQVTTGLLPNCQNSDVGPCVLFRTSGQHNVGFFGILAPPGDPQAYPGG
jgi:hypothetical protein